MKTATNFNDIDHATLRHKPQKSYAIVGAQRCGSSVLCDYLKRTGIAGNPEEYFLSWENSELAKQHSVSTQSDYLELVLEEGTSPNGVFGINIMWSTYLENVVPKLQKMPCYEQIPQPFLLQQIFPDLDFIWLIRRNKVKQAISWTIASQTDIWTVRKGDKKEPKHKPEFDFQLIDSFYQRILEGEHGWSRFFSINGVKPLQLFYEDLAEKSASLLIDVLKFLEISIPHDFQVSETSIVKQANAVNDEWEERYCSIKKR